MNLNQRWIILGGLLLLMLGWVVCPCDDFFGDWNSFWDILLNICWTLVFVSGSTIHHPRTLPSIWTDIQGAFRWRVNILYYVSLLCNVCMGDKEKMWSISFEYYAVAEFFISFFKFLLRVNNHMIITIVSIPFYFEN